MKETSCQYLVDSKCGMLVTLVGPHGAHTFRLSCRTWHCKVCRKKLVKEYVRIITDCFLKLKCVHIFVGYRCEERKQLSNFISRNVTGHYCRINGIDTSVVISDRKFNDASRCDKKKFLNKTLAEILNQPWDKGRRVSFSAGRLEQEVEESDYWGMIIGDVEWEFKKLTSDEEKKDWISKQQVYKIFQRGKEFFEQDTQVKEAQDILASQVRLKVVDYRDLEVITRKCLNGEFPYSWRHLDETTLERLAIMTVDGGMSDSEALNALGL